MDSSRSSSNLLTLCALFSLSPGRIYRGPAEYIMLNRTNKRLGGSDSVRHFLFKNRFPWVLLVGLLFLFIFTPFSWGKEKYFPLDKVKPGMPAFDEETFGPLAVLIDAKDEADAIRLTNQSDFGLGSAIWTQDLEKADHLARQIQAGSVFINGLMRSDARVPFGGIKTSGFGRELSEAGIKEFVNVKTVWVEKK